MEEPRGDRFPINYRLELEALGSAINETEIPNKVDLAHQIESSLPQNIKSQVDFSLYSFDYSKEYPGKRIRLVPGSNRNNSQLTYIDGKIITQVVINIPEFYIQSFDDGSEVIQVSFIELTLEDGSLTKFAVTNTDVQEYESDSDIDFRFADRQMVTPLGVREYSLIEIELLNMQIVDAPESHIAKARLIHKLVSRYQLGNQSRNDKTTGSYSA